MEQANFTNNVKKKRCNTVTVFSMDILKKKYKVETSKGKGDSQTRADMKKKKRGNMITIEKLLEIIQEDLAHKRRFITTEVYDGDGNRDIFQEGYNAGSDRMLEEVLETINRGGRIK